MTRVSMDCVLNLRIEKTNVSSSRKGEMIRQKGDVDKPMT